MRLEDFDEDRMNGRFAFAGNGVSAFVPGKLPQRLDLPSSTHSILYEAVLSLGELNGLGQNLKNPSLVTPIFQKREAVESTRIEGVDIRMKDVLQESIAPHRGIEDLMEIWNHDQAIESGIARLSAGEHLTLSMIEELHGTLLASVRGSEKLVGKFRFVQNQIGQVEDFQQARYVPPPVAEMHECLGQFEAFVNTGHKGHSPIAAVALAHYQFEAIHPFEDGNGRLGRALALLMLIRSKNLKLPILAMSQYLERNRKEYYDHLLNCSHSGRYIDWIEFYAKGVKEQAETASRTIIELVQLEEQLREEVRESQATEKSIRIIEHLFKRTLIGKEEAAEILECSEQTAYRQLTALVEANVLVPHKLKVISGPGRPRKYYSCQRIYEVAVRR